MGKRSDFERIPRDYYATPMAPVRPLIPYLKRDGVRTFAEPCRGDGDLVRHLESFGPRCAYAGDIATGQDALELTVADLNGADAVITNTPYRHPEDSPHSTRLLRELIEHFLDLGKPSWLLLPHAWSVNKGSAPYLRRCSDIVAVGRVKWIKGSKFTGKDDFCWYRLDTNHRGGIAFHNDRGEAEWQMAAQSLKEEANDGEARFQSCSAAERVFAGRFQSRELAKPAGFFSDDLQEWLLRQPSVEHKPTRRASS
jgi:hypothetical protein